MPATGAVVRSGTVVVSSTGRSWISRIRADAARPDWSRETDWLSWVTGSTTRNAYSRKATSPETVSWPRLTRQAPNPRITRIAPWKPTPVSVQLSASIRTARIRCRNDSRASLRMRSLSQVSERLAFTVRIARRAPSRTPPSRPIAACASCWAAASGRMTRPITAPIRTIVATMTSSSTQSSAAISTNDPTTMIIELKNSSAVEEAASRSSRVSEVTRVTSSPGERRPVRRPVRAAAVAPW